MAHHQPHGGGSHEEHEGAPEWLISFADNVTLMMGFFVVMLAMNMKASTGGAGSSPDKGDGTATDRAVDLAIAVREAFNNPVNPESRDPNDLLLIQRLQKRVVGESPADMVGIEGSEKDVQSVRPNQYFGQGGTVYFDQNSSTLNESGRGTVAEIVRLFRGVRCILDVRGHVSSAESIGKEDRGMSLSYARAVAVAAALHESGIGWEQIRLIACCDQDRVTAMAHDQAGHQSNQRVEVVGTDQPLPEYMGPEPASTPHQP